MIYDFLKRLTDIVGSAVGLILLSPLLLFVAAAIKIDSLGPVMADTPMRAGKDGKLFKIYKFRSMVQNAHEILENNPELLKEYKKNGYKIFNDPRVTRVGKFIRKYSVDEFPQFLNVLNGDMSFVGPRPFRPDELEKYATERPDIKWKLDKILTAKPGITGLWQTSGRSELTFDQRIDLEVKYAESCSFLLDLYIIVKTPFAVIKAKGAF